MRKTAPFGQQMRHLPLVACLAALWQASPAWAQAAPMQAHYDGYAKGLHVFDLDVALSLQKTAYRLQVSFRLTGVLGTLFHGDGTTVVDGRFDGFKAAPRELFSTGQFRGVPHVAQIDWRDGSPAITQMAPAAEEDREKVPPSEQAHTIDAFSAIAMLLHQVTETGRCEAETRTFDGVRLSEFTARTIGEEPLDPTGRSSFQGQALHCDVTGRMIAGFLRDSDQEALRKPKQGSVWFARLRPGQPLLPVRIVFYSDGAPSATLYLNDLPAPPGKG